MNRTRPRGTFAILMGVNGNEMKRMSEQQRNHWVKIWLATLYWQKTGSCDRPTRAYTSLNLDSNVNHLGHELDRSVDDRQTTSVMTAVTTVIMTASAIATTTVRVHATMISSGLISQWLRERPRSWPPTFQKEWTCLFFPRSCPLSFKVLKETNTL